MGGGVERERKKGGGGKGAWEGGWRTGGREGRGICCYFFWTD